MTENLDWIAIAQRGFEAWKAKPHNARWFRKIDGTPIPNDLTICIGQAFADELARRSPPPAVEGGWRELLREALPHVIESADYDDEGRVGNAVEAARDLVSRIDAALAPTPPAGEKP